MDGFRPIKTVKMRKLWFNYSFSADQKQKFYKTLKIKAF